MLADLHIHTNRYSGCSNVDPISAVRRAEEIGLDIIALTEHGIRWPDSEITALVNAAGVRTVTVIPGQEVACYSTTGAFQGELLVFGYPESLGSNKSVEAVIALVHRNGGIVIAAHPFKKRKIGEGFYGGGHAIVDWDIDGLEVEHPSYDKESRLLANSVSLAKNIPGIGCSDAHDVGAIGLCRTVFDADVRQQNDLIEEIRKGKVIAVRCPAEPR